MMRMHTGSFQMAPLSDFIVTKKDYRAKAKVEWADWVYQQSGRVDDYDVVDGYRIVFKTIQEPDDVEIVMPHNNPPYELIWAK